MKTQENSEDDDIYRGRRSLQGGKENLENEWF